MKRTLSVLLVALGFLACEEVYGEESTNIVSGPLLRLGTNTATTNVVVENMERAFGMSGLPKLKLSTVPQKTLLPWQDMSLIHRDSVGSMPRGEDEFFWSVVRVPSGSLGWYIRNSYPISVSGPGKGAVGIGLMWRINIK